MKTAYIRLRKESVPKHVVKIPKHLCLAVDDMVVLKHLGEYVVGWVSRLANDPHLVTGKTAIINRVSETI